MKTKIKKIDVVIIVTMMVIAGFVLNKYDFFPETDDDEIPYIDFVKDEVNDTLTVKSVSGKVLWEDIKIEGNCDKSSLGRYVKEGDIITYCKGIIIIRHDPTDTLLYTYKFAQTAKLPYSPLISGSQRDVSPEDEGVHYNKILNYREWWYYTVIFDDDSDMPGWTATIGFCHMAWGDLLLTFKPDILVVILHSPDGKEYGGLINKDRGKMLGLLGSPTLEASTPGVDIKYEDSWALGSAPEWRVHVEDNDIDKENEIIMDLNFFAPSLPLWLHSSALLDKGEGEVANYIFTGCEVNGEVILNGLKYKVKGTGHHEHSWSLGATKSLIKGWDICHIKLDNGWHVYYSKYYLTKQRLESYTSKINPLTKIIVTTDKGETITMLEDSTIQIKESDRLFLLLKMASKLKITATPSVTQVLLKTFNIRLNLDITAEHAYDKIWKFPTYVGMKIGLASISGKVRWDDDDGDHEIELSGTGTIWNMRRF